MSAQDEAAIEALGRTAEGLARVFRLGGPMLHTRAGGRLIAAGLKAVIESSGPAAAAEIAEHYASGLRDLVAPAAGLPVIGKAAKR